MESTGAVCRFAGLIRGRSVAVRYPLTLRRSAAMWPPVRGARVIRPLPGKELNIAHRREGRVARFDRTGRHQDFTLLLWAK